MTQSGVRLVEGSIQSVRLPGPSALLLAGVIVVLLAVVGYALQRELGRQSVSGSAASAAVGPPVRVLSAAEEAYATALWPIHRDVKLAALGMSFAGIAYKTDGQDANRLQAEIRPLLQEFRAATSKVQALKVPASMREVHERYLRALDSYENAANEMVQATRDGRDQLLIEAQGMSFHASEDVLRVGDILWPGEYKPH